MRSDPVRRFFATKGLRHVSRGHRPVRCRFWYIAIAVFAAGASAVWADELPVLHDVEFQPLSAQVKRVVEALDMLGQPLGRDEKARLDEAVDSTGGDPAIRTIQKCPRPPLLGRDRDQRREPGQGDRRARPPPRLVQNGWSVFLVKVHNQAGVTAAARRRKPQRRPGLPAVDQPRRAEAIDPARRCRPALGRRRHVQRPAAQELPFRA